MHIGSGVVGGWVEVWEGWVVKNAVGLSQERGAIHVRGGCLLNHGGLAAQAVAGALLLWLSKSVPPSPAARHASEGKRRPQKRLEEVAKAVVGGYCRVQMPLNPALSIRETVGGQWLGALEGGGGGAPPLPVHPCP